MARTFLMMFVLAATVAAIIAAMPVEAAVTCRIVLLQLPSNYSACDCCIAATVSPSNVGDPSLTFNHSTVHSQPAVGGERTVKKLGLSKALTIPEGTTVSEACRRMAARRVDAVLLNDSNALLSGIITDKDISARVIACQR